MPHQPEGATDQRPYRIPGELEREDPTIEPLPPTPITDEAQEFLREWGLSDEHISRLQEHVSSMRYDLVPQKAERIARNGGYIFVEPAGNSGESVLPQELLLLPGLGAFEGRGDGACGELTVQLGRQLYTSGYLEEINAHARAQGKPELRLAFVGGQSRTHFIDPKDTHMWLGLTSGEEGPSMITVDPSFQEISAGDNGYHIRGAEGDIPSDLPLAASLRVGTYSEDNLGIFTLDAPRTLILGSSFDRRLVYAISASKEAEAGTYHLGLHTYLPDGKKGSGYVIGKHGVIHKSVGNDTIITPAHHQEMQNIINTLAGITISHDQIQAQAYRDMKHSQLSFYR